MLFRNDDYANTICNVNVFVELDYVVQFKDQKPAFRYTRGNGANTALNVPGDTMQKPRVYQYWGSLA